VPTIYVETNFVVGYAFSQRTKHENILGAAKNRKIRLRIPEVCIMEAYAAIDRKLNDYNVLANEIRARVKQLRRSGSSPAANTAVGSLESAQLDLAAVGADVLTRRDVVLQSLSEHAAFFSIECGWFVDPARRTLIDSPRDSLIADAIIADGQKSPFEALYYTENSSDFDTPSVRAALLISSTKLTGDINVAVAYAEGRRSWMSLA